MAGYDINQKPGESLEKYYRRLAKTADQRLVRLESYEHDKYFKTATLWAYAKAQKDIQKWQNKGPDAKQLRFNTAPPKGGEQLIAKINDIKAFLESPTSTKQGIINVYKKRADTVNKKYGTKFTWQQLAKYYESEDNEKWDAKFGSKTALRTLGYIQKNKSKILDAIQKADGKDIRINDSSLIARTVEMALNDNNLSIKDLI